MPLFQKRGSEDLTVFNSAAGWMKRSIHVCVEITFVSGSWLKCPGNRSNAHHTHDTP